MPFPSRFLPCEECGASVERTASAAHSCDPERLAEYRLFHLREDVAAFEERLRGWLSSGAGRFEQWVAARDVRRTA